MEDTSWICLGCARQGGKQQDCVECESATIETLQQKADKAVKSLILQHKQGKWTNHLPWEK